MKLYSMVTPSHKILEQEWFLPSLPNEFDVHVVQYERTGPGETYGTQPFGELMRVKAGIIRDAVASNQGEVILWSDVDVQFFAPAVDLIRAAIGDKDFAFQRGWGQRDWVCAGFFACRCTPRTLAFWTAVAGRTLLLPPYVPWRLEFWIAWVGGALVLRPYSDERAANAELGNWRFVRGPNRYSVSWCYLPDTFFHPGIHLNGMWQQGDQLEVPAGVVAHHASRASGLENKIAMLRYVRDIDDARRTYPLTPL